MPRTASAFLDSVGLKKWTAATPGSLFAAAYATPRYANDVFPLWHVPRSSTCRVGVAKISMSLRHAATDSTTVPNTASRGTGADVNALNAASGVTGAASGLASVTEVVASAAALLPGGCAPPAECASFVSRSRRCPDSFSIVRSLSGLCSVSWMSKRSAFGRLRMQAISDRTCTSTQKDATRFRLNVCCFDKTHAAMRM